MIDLNDIRKELERKTALTYEIETTEYIGGRVASTKRKTFRERSVTLPMEMADAILEQLKPVKPVRDKETGRFWKCGNCGAYVGFEDPDPSDANEFNNYCGKCGRLVSWDED